MAPKPLSQDDRDDEERRREKMRPRALGKPHIQKIQKMRQARLDGGAQQSSTPRVASDRDGAGGQNKTKRDTIRDQVRRHHPPAAGPTTLDAGAAQPRQSSSLHRSGQSANSLKRPLPGEFILRTETAEKRRADIATKEAEDSEGGDTIAPPNTLPREKLRSSGRAEGESMTTLRTHGKSANQEPVYISDGSSTASSIAASPRQSRGDRAVAKQCVAQRTVASPTPSMASHGTRFWSVDRLSSPIQIAEPDDVDELEEEPIEGEEPIEEEEPIEGEEPGPEQQLLDEELFETGLYSDRDTEEEFLAQDLLPERESDGALASEAPIDDPPDTFQAPGSDDSVFESDVEVGLSPPTRSPVIHVRDDSPPAPSVTQFSSLSSPTGSRPASAGGDSFSGISLDSSVLEPSSTCQTDGTLKHYLDAISDQHTRGGSDYLEAQGEVYQQVIRDFFDVECNCKDPCEAKEPDNGHTVEERVAQLQQSLPPLQKIFGEDASYDPSAHFNQWKRFLSHQPPEPLSFRKTCHTLR